MMDQFDCNVSFFCKEIKHITIKKKHKIRMKLEGDKYNCEIANAFFHPNDIETTHGCTDICFTQNGSGFN